MAKAYTVKSPQWWKHLRSWKRVFWKKERKRAKEQTNVRDQKE